jgi:putative flippase GtrA
LATWTSLRARFQALPQFGRFAAIGAAAFFVDYGILQFCIAYLGVTPGWGRMFSFLCGATFTWYMNRHLTFSDHRSSERGREWATYVSSCAVAAVPNIGAYSLFLRAVGISQCRLPLRSARAPD